MTNTNLIADLVESLNTAFGGCSQVQWETYGAALAGRIRNGRARVGAEELENTLLHLINEVDPEDEFEGCGEAIRHGFWASNARIPIMWIGSEAYTPTGEIDFGFHDE